MSFSIAAIADTFSREQNPERWLSLSTTEHHQIRDCAKNADDSYDLWFYSRPPMTLQQHQATSSTYSLTYVTPVLQNQVSRKARMSSIEKGVLIYTADGVFKVESSRYDKIYITHKGKTEREEKKALYVEVQTRLGKRLFLYTRDVDGFLQPLIAHHAIMGIYKAPNYSYIPEQLDASNASWIPPLAQSVYDYEAKYVKALGTDYAHTAEAMGRICKVDPKTVSQLQAVRTQATFTTNGHGLAKKVYALSRYLPEDGTTKNTVTTTTTTSTYKAPPKVATVDGAKLKAVVVGLHKRLCQARDEEVAKVTENLMTIADKTQGANA